MKRTKGFTLIELLVVIAMPLVTTSWTFVYENSSLLARAIEYGLGDQT